MRRSLTCIGGLCPLAVPMSLVLLALAIGLPSGRIAQAQGPTVDEIRAMFQGWDASRAVAAGYGADPFCIDGRLIGAPEAGTMGFHYVNPALFDGTLDAVKPEAVLIHPDGATVMGIEYLVADVGQPTPTLFGQAFEGPMPGHGPGQPTHYDLHVWFIANPAGRFADFNPTVPLCPTGSLPPVEAPGAPAAGDSSLPRAITILALLGVLALGAGSKLAFSSRR